VGDLGNLREKTNKKKESCGSYEFWFAAGRKKRRSRRGNRRLMIIRKEETRTREKSGES